MFKRVSDSLRDFWRSLGFFGDFLEILEISGDFSDTPKVFQKVTEGFRDFWRFLDRFPRSFREFRRFLNIFGEFSETSTVF